MLILSNVAVWDWTLASIRLTRYQCTKYSDVGMGIRHICLNLRRSAERRRHAREQFRKFRIPATFVEAIDGSTLSIRADGVGKEFIYRGEPWLHRRHRVPHLRQRDLSANVLGCALSHYLAYCRLTRTDSCDALFIFEDDFIIGSDPERFGEYMRNLPPFDSFDLCFFSERHSRGLPYPSDERLNDYYGRIRRGFLWYSGTSAYICTRRGADKLYQGGRVIRFAADDYLNYMINKLDLVAICPKRPLIVGHGTFPSEIGTGCRHGDG